MLPRRRCCLEVPFRDGFEGVRVLNEVKGLVQRDHPAGLPVLCVADQRGRVNVVNRGDDQVVDEVEDNDQEAAEDQSGGVALGGVGGQPHIRVVHRGAEREHAEQREAELPERVRGAVLVRSRVVVPEVEEAEARVDEDDVPLDGHDTQDPGDRAQRVRRGDARHRGVVKEDSGAKHSRELARGGGVHERRDHCRRHRPSRKPRLVERRPVQAGSRPPAGQAS
mmetsp:Transcript_46044/g.104009  ORF Transcript_46044/g.104009 Transcript_46044/m.104009 type:complete len:223 (-) Transcript_46044:615-1283(-)